MFRWTGRIKSWPSHSTDQPLPGTWPWQRKRCVDGDTLPLCHIKASGSHWTECSSPTSCTRSNYAKVHRSSLSTPWVRSWEVDSIMHHRDLETESFGLSWRHLSLTKHSNHTCLHHGSSIHSERYQSCKDNFQSRFSSLGRKTINAPTAKSLSFARSMTIGFCCWARSSSNLMDFHGPFTMDFDRVICSWFWRRWHRRIGNALDLDFAGIQMGHGLCQTQESTCGTIALVQMALDLRLIAVDDTHDVLHTFWRSVPTYHLAVRFVPKLGPAQDQTDGPSIVQSDAAGSPWFSSGKGGGTSVAQSSSSDRVDDAAEPKLFRLVHRLEESFQPHRKKASFQGCWEAGDARTPAQCAAEISGRSHSQIWCSWRPWFGNCIFLRISGRGSAFHHSNARSGLELPHIHESFLSESFGLLVCGQFDTSCKRSTARSTCVFCIADYLSTFWTLYGHREDLCVGAILTWTTTIDATAISLPFWCEWTRWSNNFWGSKKKPSSQS